jgi:CheY-like chemotaxis protein
VDKEANAAVLQRLFQNWPSVWLHSCNTARAGLAAARMTHPDLVLLDLHLLDLSGEEVFARLRGDLTTATIPVVVLSAGASPGTIRRLLARGATSYLTKPLDLNELQSVVAQEYPAVLFTVSANDVRVDPMHARKMCAALQHATAVDARSCCAPRRTQAIRAAPPPGWPHSPRTPSPSSAGRPDWSCVDRRHRG